MNNQRDYYWDDFDPGEIHIRDTWQFELKSEFFPNASISTNQYTQEFYLFIPSSLQITPETYSKQQFYLDQTNLFRYKTPTFTIKELLNFENKDSSLTRLIHLSSDLPPSYDQVTDELKLLANIIRSALRNEIKNLSNRLNSEESIKDSDHHLFLVDTETLCNDIERLQESYKTIKEKFFKIFDNQSIIKQFSYVEEFIGDAVLHYLSHLLENIRLNNNPQFQQIDAKLTAIIIREKQFEELYTSPLERKRDTSELFEGENIVYRTSLLNKFIMGALQLTTNRFSMDQRYQHWIGGMSAGVAMLIYFSLYVWLGNVFVINSEPFILLTVVIYVLKDRIKEWLRAFSYVYLHTSRWFPDYRIIIQSQHHKTNLGQICEWFSFVNQAQLPKDLKEIRNAEFHTVLETYQRQENILFYKRIVRIKNFPKNLDARRCGLNFIFRFSVQHFLYKASDPDETHLTLDPTTKELVHIRLPKVYHLNVIIRTTSQHDCQKNQIEVKKIRLIVNKNGIKRIELIK